MVVYVCDEAHVMSLSISTHYHPVVALMLEMTLVFCLVDLGIGEIQCKCFRVWN